MSAEIEFIVGRHCPTCSSPKPELHPGIQLGGEVEVSICRDPYHGEQALEQPARSPITATDEIIALLDKGAFEIPPYTHKMIAVDAAKEYVKRILGRTSLIAVILLYCLTLTTQASAQTRIETGITFAAIRNGHFTDTRVGGYGRIEHTGRWGAVGEVRAEMADKPDSTQRNRSLLIAVEGQVRRQVKESSVYVIAGASFGHLTAFGGKTSFGPLGGIGVLRGAYDLAAVFEADVVSENRTKALRLDAARRFSAGRGWFVAVRGSLGAFWFAHPHDPGGASSGIGARVQIGIGR